MLTIPFERVTYHQAESLCRAPAEQYQRSTTGMHIYSLSPLPLPSLTMALQTNLPRHRLLLLLRPIVRLPRAYYIASPKQPQFIRPRTPQNVFPRKPPPSPLSFDPMDAMPITEKTHTRGTYIASFSDSRPLQRRHALSASSPARLLDDCNETPHRLGPPGHHTHGLQSPAPGYPGSAADGRGCRRWICVAAGKLT